MTSAEAAGVTLGEIINKRLLCSDSFRIYHIPKQPIRKNKLQAPVR